MDVSLCQVDDQAWQTCEGPFVPDLGEGYHTLHFFSVDNAGNVEEVKSKIFKIDRTTPYGAASPQPKHRNARVFEVAWNGFDSTSGLARVRLHYSTDGGNAWTDLGVDFTSSTIMFSAPTDGTYHFNIQAFDNAGNSEELPNSPDFVEISVVVDTIPPVTMHNPIQGSGSYGWYVTDVDMELICSDSSPSSGFKATYYRVDDGLWTAYTGVFTISDNGVHTITYYSVDNAGNQEAPKTITLKIDQEYPTSTVQDLPECINTLTFEIYYSASDSVSGIAGVELWFKALGNMTFEPYGASGTIFTSSPISFVTLTDGDYEFYTCAIDVAGNTEDCTSLSAEPMIIDTINPVIETYYPIMDWHTTDVNLTLNATDEASGIHEILYSIDGGEWISFMDSSVEIRISENGTHTISFYSTDNAGNQEAMRSITIRVDASAPFSNASPLPTRKNTLTFEIYYTASDSVSGISSVELWYSVDGASYQLFGSFASSPIGFVAPREGEYAFFTCAWDNAGNRELVCPPTIPDTSTTVHQAEDSATQSSVDRLFGIVVLLVLIVLGLSIITLFLIARRKALPGEEAPGSGTDLIDGDEQVSSHKVSCPWCKQSTDAEGSFCNNCGGYVGAEVAPSSPATVSEDSMMDEMGGGM